MSGNGWKSFLLALLFLFGGFALIYIGKAFFFSGGTEFLINMVDQVPMLGNLLSSFGSGILTGGDLGDALLQDAGMMYALLEQNMVQSELIASIIFILSEIMELLGIKNLLKASLSALLGVTMGLFINKAFSFAGEWGPLVPTAILTIVCLVLVFFTKPTIGKRIAAYFQLAIQVFTVCASSLLAITLAVLFQMAHPDAQAYVFLLIVPYLLCVAMALLNAAINLVTDSSLRTGAVSSGLGLLFGSRGGFFILFVMSLIVFVLTAVFVVVGVNL